MGGPAPRDARPGRSPASEARQAAAREQGSSALSVHAAPSRLPWPARPTSPNFSRRVTRCGSTRSGPTMCRTSAARPAQGSCWSTRANGDGPSKPANGSRSSR